MSLALLAGGKGSRMGCPKHRLVHAHSGQTLLQVQCGRMINPCWSNKFVVGLPTALMPAGWTALDDPEEFSGHGPLAAILAALTHADAARVAVLPIDAPAFPEELLLTAAGQPESYDWITFSDQEGREQWLYSVISTRLVAELEKALREDRRAVHVLARASRLRVLKWEPSWPREAMTNLNSPDQLGEWTMPSEKTN